MTSLCEVQARGLDVGFLTPGWAPDIGGIESHAGDLARFLLARGHRVRVLCLDGSPGLAPYSTWTSTCDGVEIRRMAYRYEDHRGLADIVANPKGAAAVSHWMADSPCDVVHVHHLTGFGAGALRAIAANGAPALMTLHDYWMICPRGQMLRSDGGVSLAPEPETCARCIAATWPHLMPSGGGRRTAPDGSALETDAEAARARTSYALSALEIPARLLVPSQAALSVFRRAGLSRAGIEVCENGIDARGIADEVARLRAGGAGNHAGTVLGFLGSVQPSKGVLELLRAFRAARVPGLALEIHGPVVPYHGDRSYVDAVRGEVDSCERVCLCGPYAKRDLPRVLAGLDGVAVPSLWPEVFGLAAREARAAGLALLASDAGGLSESIVHEREGLIVRAGDAAAWVEAIRRFGTDGALRARWRAAPPRVRSIEEMGLAIEHTYRDVVC